MSSTLLERLKSLEREVARQRGAREILATKLTLVDDTGRPRATLEMQDGHPTLTLADEVGDPRVILQTTEDGAALQMFDDNRQQRANVEVDGFTVSVNLLDIAGQLKVGLGDFPEGPGVALWDDEGAARVALNVHHDKTVAKLWGHTGAELWHSPVDEEQDPGDSLTIGTGGV